MRHYLSSKLDKIERKLQKEQSNVYILKVGKSHELKSREDLDKELQKPIYNNAHVIIDDIELVFDELQKQGE